MSYADIAIRGGTVITPDSSSEADIAIVGEKIVQIGGQFEANETIDASNQLVIPGAFDAHVHLSSPPEPTSPFDWIDDFTSGSRGALAGGVTTVGNMTFLNSGETPLEGMSRESIVVRQEAIADVVLHPVIEKTSKAILDEIPKLLAAGCNSIKFFMSMSSFDNQVDGFLEATRRAGVSELMTMIHCEDFAIISDATSQLLAKGQSSLRYYPESRPIVAEVVATQRAVAFAEATGAPVYIVHVSSKQALEVCVEAQARGVQVYVETRPTYLHLTDERFDEEDFGKYLSQPPLRKQRDVDAMWAGIQQGIVHTVCSDHAPWSLASKLDPEHTVANPRPGVENLQTMVPMLYSEGVRSGRISMSRFIEVTSTNAAKLFGIYPQKGTIAVGSDADVVIFDPILTKTIESSMILSNVDYTVYEGWEVTGWPTVTVRRGTVVYQHGEVIGKPGSGQLIRRGPAMLL